ISSMPLSFASSHIENHRRITSSRFSIILPPLYLLNPSSPFPPSPVRTAPLPACGKPVLPAEGPFLRRPPGLPALPALLRRPLFPPPPPEAAAPRRSRPLPPSG